MSDQINKYLGPCAVIWDPDGDNLELNPTHGGVTFRYREAFAELHQDQMGVSVKDRVAVGVEECSLEVPMDESDITQLSKAFACVQTGANSVLVKNPVGIRILPLAKEVVVKRIVGGAISADTNEWLHIFRAYPQVDMEWKFDSATQRTTKITLQGYPDDASGQIGWYWRAGPAI